MNLGSIRSLLGSGNRIPQVNLGFVLPFWWSLSANQPRLTLRHISLPPNVDRLAPQEEKRTNANSDSSNAHSCKNGANPKRGFVVTILGGGLMIRTSA